LTDSEPKLVQTRLQTAELVVADGKFMKEITKNTERVQKTDN